MNPVYNSDVNKISRGQTDNCLGQPGNISQGANTCGHKRGTNYSPWAAGDI